ncbi:MAG: hypothetical protein ACP5H2_00795 [Solirubrobacteraceae bacterium]
MTSPLDSSNPYGIRVVTGSAEVRADAKAVFDKASKRAAKGISEIAPTPKARTARRRNGTASAAKASG